MSQALQIRLVRSHGYATDAAWPLVPGDAFSMRDTFAASPVPLSPEDWAAASQCRARSVGTALDDTATWCLVNGAGDLACAINQRLLQRGEKAPLHAGDVIELGLLQFVVEEQTASPIHSDRHAHAAFKLTDLLDADSSPNAAVPLARHSLQAKTSRQLIDAHADPFDDIADAAYRIDVAAPAVRAHAEPARPDAADGTAADEADDPTDDVMRHLHAEYLRLMHNPNEPVAAMDWSRHDLSPRHADETLHDLTQDAARFESVYDILGHSADIEAILNGLDTLNDTDVLAEDPRVNVLRLFAPADLLVQETGLPSLTRREHHALSADSAAAWDRMPPARPESAAPSSAPFTVEQPER